MKKKQLVPTNLIITIYYNILEKIVEILTIYIL